jgi:hypothetical protein
MDGTNSTSNLASARQSTSKHFAAIFLRSGSSVVRASKHSMYRSPDPLSGSSAYRRQSRLNLLAQSTAPMARASSTMRGEPQGFENWQAFRSIWEHSLAARPEAPFQRQRRRCCGCLSRSMKEPVRKLRPFEKNSSDCIWSALHGLVGDAAQHARGASSSGRDKTNLKTHVRTCYI